jgi:hypothetical protein
LRSWNDIRTGRWALVWGATLAVARLGFASPALTPVTASGGPQIMLFVSQPLGATASPKFGLRLENLGTSRDAAGFAEPLRHQPLMALQFNADNHMQLQIGRNVAFGRDASGWHSSSPLRNLQTPTRATSVPLPSVVH